jgi:Tol biopolymer transport system component
MNDAKIEKAALAFAAVCSLILSGAITTSIIYLLISLSSLVTIRPAFAQSTAGVQLEAGIEKEEVDGDLKSAMEVYQKIAADSSAPRDVRSKALLRLAGCYEKLGRQARQVYEQIVRDFADEPAAAQARSRLAALKQQEHPAPPATMTVRKIEWSAVGNMGASDTDGQRAVYADSGGNLFLGDLAGHSKRMIFKPQADDTLEGWNPSRDFSMVGLGLRAKSNRQTLAAIKADGTGYRELVRDDPQGTILGGRWEGQWSWDNRYMVVVSNRQKGGGHLFVVSVADGQRRELLSIETGYFAKAVFSPDGRFVAYEVAPLPDQSESSHVFIMPAQGGEPRQVYQSVPRPAQNVLGLEFWTLLDWTADGRYLAIADARKGKTGLYLLPVKNGSAAGNPVFVRYGDFREGYSTAAGQLVYRAIRPGGAADVFLASFDSNGNLGSWRRLDLRGGSINGPYPSFSPDGTHIAYVAQDDDDAGGSSLVWHDLSSGEERVLYRSGRYLFCESALHNTEIFCTEDKGGGTTDLASVVVESGEVNRLESFTERRGIVRWIRGSTRDDKALYLTKLDLIKDDGPVVRWDLATKQETALLSPSDTDRFHLPTPSLDGRWLLADTSEGLFVRPLSGGDWKLHAPGDCWPYTSTPDGNWVVYKGTDAAGKQSLFRVPIGGGQPQRLGDLPVQGQFQGIWRSPDGRQILAVSMDWTKYDLWVLDNFVPSVKQ